MHGWCVSGEAVGGVRVSQGTLDAKQRVFVDIESASISVRADRSTVGHCVDCASLQGQGFADPDSVIPTRDIDKYLVGDGAAK